MSNQSLPPSDEEEEWLAKICDFEIEESTFDDWKKTHETLDIAVTQHFTIGEIGDQATVTVRYTSTTREYQNGVSLNIRKEKKEITLKLNDKSPGKYHFEFKGMGDCQGQQKGDLRVILIIKE